MAVIKPFRGLRFNGEKVGDLGAVMAPPYDIIPPAAQEALAARHSHNVIRLELGETHPQDDEHNNRYTRAAAYLRTWLREGALIVERQPALYVYQMEHDDADGHRRTQTGLLASVHLENFESGRVLPHEKTLPRAKEDRLQLLRACRANLSPIFAIYSKQRAVTALLLAQIERAEPLVSVMDADGVQHRLYVVSERAIHERVGALMADSVLYIADGHHRYETALRYRDEMRQATGLSEAAPHEEVLMLCVDMEDPGLTILPTHRLVRDITIDRRELLAELERWFAVERLPFPAGDGVRRLGDDAVRAASWRRLAVTEGEHTFGLYLGGHELYLLSRPLEAPLPPGALEGFSPAYRSLDVAVLHAIAFKVVLGLDTDDHAVNERHITYLRDAEEALRGVQSGEGELAFFLNGTRVEQVRAVAHAGETMPHKSTYFHPKALTGPVMRSLDLSG